MSAYILEWVNLLGRWVHMITGIAWIGASFYFVWLDNHLLPVVDKKDTEKGVAGEVWSVHGGGFYHAQKYQLAPETLPDTLNWFKWEAYTTWISGMFMLALMYWYSAEIYLIDPAVAQIGKPVAVFIGMVVIVAGWFAYDFLCKSRVGQKENVLAAIMLVLLTLVAWLLCQVFSGRGAYMHFGAMLGTIMVANVFFVIIPGQKDLVRAKTEGRAPDPIHGIRGKQRSVHNTYFTLPVLFVMVSNHYAMTFAHDYNWAILIAISVIGALIRVYFVARHKGNASIIPIILAAALLLALIVALAPAGKSARNTASKGSESAVSENLAAVEIGQVHSIVLARCTTCHANDPAHPGFQAAPKGIVLESEADVFDQAATIHQQSVVTKAMPIGNLTGITDEERALIDRWYQQLSQ